MEVLHVRNVLIRRILFLSGFVQISIILGNGKIKEQLSPFVSWKNPVLMEILERYLITLIWCENLNLMLLSM